MEGYIAEVRLFAGNFAPKNWAFCQGQLMSIAQNTALFSLLGTTYGGDGQTTFGLPDFRGRVAIGTGQGAGLSDYVLGEMAGTPAVTLLQMNLPPHSHVQMASGDSPTQNTAQGAALASNTRSTNPPMAPIYTGANNPVPMSSYTAPTGNNQPLNIMQPYLGMNYIVCLYGIYPSRN